MSPVVRVISPSMAEEAALEQEQEQEEVRELSSPNNDQGAIHILERSLQA